MDGPNVNLKFINELKIYMKENSYNHQILDIGSCGLHVVHNSFKNGVKAMDWSIVDFLRSIYNIFIHSSARRSDYTSASRFHKSFALFDGWKINHPC